MHWTCLTKELFLRWVGKKVNKKLLSHYQCFHGKLFEEFTLKTYSILGAQSRIFQGMGGFLQKKKFDKHLIYNTRKKESKENDFGILIPRFLEPKDDHNQDILSKIKALYFNLKKV